MPGTRPSGKGNPGKPTTRLGAPWLPGQIAGLTGALSLEAKLATLCRHVEAGHAFYGEPGVRIMRKHVQWYLEQLPELGDVEARQALRQRFNALTAMSAQRDFLASIARPLAA